MDFGSRQDILTNGSAAIIRLRERIRKKEDMMKTCKENMEDHADSLLLLTRDDWNLNNRSEMLYHIKQLQSYINDIK
jgi:hypothetical protein